MADESIFLIRYRNKTSEELIDIIESPKYLDEAKLTALAVLEERGMATDELIAKKSHLTAKTERIIVQRRNRSRYDNFLRRLAAAIIDSFVLWPISFLFQHIMVTEIIWIAGLFNFIRMLFPYIYSILLHTEYGQTLGKMAMSIKVIDKGEIEVISFRQAFLRDIVPVAIVFVFTAFSILMPANEFDSINAGNVAYLIPTILLGSLSILWIFIELISMLFDERKRAVHDLIAKTVVVKVIN